MHRAVCPRVCPWRVRGADMPLTRCGQSQPLGRPVFVGVCACPVPLLAALVVLDPPPSAFIFDESGGGQGSERGSKVEEVDGVEGVGTGRLVVEMVDLTKVTLHSKVW